MPDGVYIRGSVQGYPLLFTTDTGASKTIISNRVFESLKPEDRPELEETSKLVGASGVSIKERGKGIFCLKLGSVKMEVEAIVAEIDDDGLLGVDILQNGKNGPADLLMSKGVLMIDKKEIPIIQVGVNNRVRNVTAADHFVIPAQTECDVYIERQEYDDFSSEKEYAVEPTDHFQAEYPSQISSTLVDLNRVCTCKVRKLNPFPTAMHIKQDAVIGRAEPIEGIPVVITNEEDSSKFQNHVAVRRIKLLTSEHAHSLPEYTARKIQTEDSTEIPSHLVDLYEKTSQGLTGEQKQEGITTFGANTRPKEELGKLQREDPDIMPILSAKVTGNKPSSQDMVTCSPATRHYWILWDSLVVYDGILLKKFIKRDGSGEYLQFIVPLSMKKEVLFQMHNSLVSGHLGCKKTKEKILQRFYWYSLKDEVVLHIQKCDTCAADKRPPKVPRAPMGSLRVGAPGDCIATDYLGPLPITDRGHRYILLFTDHFTKNVEVIPVGDMTAEVCAQKLLNEVISRWGCPLSIHSDQGRTYESRAFKELCRMLEIRKTRTSARNPRGNGQAERFNRTLLRMIKAYLCGEQTEWDLHLGCLAGAYRATPNESTRLTPNMLTIGREVRLPAELVFGSTNTYNGEEITTYGDYVDILRTKMQHAHEIARKYMATASKRSKELYDVKVAFHRYQEGDVVWCLMEVRKVGVTPKLEYVYEGPFLVKKKLSELDYVLQLDRSGKERPVHHNKLKPYEGDHPPRWVVKAKRQFSNHRTSQQ